MIIEPKKERDPLIFSVYEKGLSARIPAWTLYPVALVEKVYRPSMQAGLRYELAELVPVPHRLLDSTDGYLVCSKRFLSLRGLIIFRWPLRNRSAHLFHGRRKQADQRVVLWPIKFLQAELKCARVRTQPKGSEQPIPKRKQ